jgi:hypothetical protein
MLDGPRHDDVFCAWTRYQAEVLRTLRTRDNRFDREHLAEEIEDLGKSERDAVRSQVRRVLVHFLKLAHSPSRDPLYTWMGSIVEARARLADKLSPSLRRDIEEALDRLYTAAWKQAAVELQAHGRAKPISRCPANALTRSTRSSQKTGIPPGPNRRTLPARRHGRPRRGRIDLCRSVEPAGAIGGTARSSLR